MDLFDAVFLARLQFAFTVGFHIIFPAFSIGLASYLAVLEGLWLWTGRDVYLDLFHYWKKIFAVVFGMGVVSGHRDELPVRHQLERVLGQDGPGARAADGLRGAVRLFPRGRLPRRHAVRAASGSGRGCISSPPRWSRVGTLLSAFWILSVNSWMQTPAGYAINDVGQFVPADWWAVIFNPSFPYRLVHMVLAAYLTTALRGRRGRRLAPAARPATRPRRAVMFSMAMWMAAIVAPIQIVAGECTG